MEHFKASSEEQIPEGMELRTSIEMESLNPKSRSIRSKSFSGGINLYPFRTPPFNKCQPVDQVKVSYDYLKTPTCSSDSLSITESDCGHSMEDQIKREGRSSYNHKDMIFDNQNIKDHFFNVGFLQGMFRDCVLLVGNQKFNLHRIVLSQSPVLSDIIALKSNCTMFSWDRSSHSLKFCSNDEELLEISIIACVRFMYGEPLEFNISTSIKYLIGALVLRLDKLFDSVVWYLEQNMMNDITHWPNLSHQLEQAKRLVGKNTQLEALEKRFILVLICRLYDSTKQSIEIAVSLSDYIFNIVFRSASLWMPSEFDRYIVLRNICAMRLFKNQDKDFPELISVWKYALQNNENQSLKQTAELYLKTLRESINFSQLSSMEQYKIQDDKLIPSMFFKPTSFSLPCRICVTLNYHELELASKHYFQIFKYQGHQWQIIVMSFTEKKIGIYVKLITSKLPSVSARFDIFVPQLQKDSLTPIFHSPMKQFHVQQCWGWKSRSLHMCWSEQNPIRITCLLQCDSKKSPL